MVYKPTYNCGGPILHISQSFPYPQMSFTDSPPDFSVEIVIIFAIFGRWQDMSPFTVMAMDISCSYKRLFLWDSTFYKFGVFLVSGWWYTYLYEKYEFVSWDYEIPN